VLRISFESREKQENGWLWVQGDSRLIIVVTLNIATEADLANGSCGIIHDIIFNPREQIASENINNDGIVWLQYPPAMILFQPFHHKFDPFPRLEAGLIPIFPTEVSFNICYHHNPKTKVHQRQYPICAGFAFTDHKAQGQTLGKVIIGISTTSHFPVTPCSAYVALSRSRGRDTIRLLRDFDKAIFTKHPSEHLWKEDERLEGLIKDTTDKFNVDYYDN
jgi:ATP-dependent exoDNAse (exonuclease V) alpha subunit